MVMDTRAGDMVTTRPIMFTFTQHFPSPELRMEQRVKFYRLWHKIPFGSCGGKQKPEQKVDVFKTLHFSASADLASIKIP